MSVDPGTRERILWGAWRVADDGGLEIVLTLEGEDGPERRRLDFASLEAAERALGTGFRDVVEKVLAADRRRGRWRP